MNPAILIVDDEKSICSAIKRTFHKQPFRVFSANSGLEALNVIQENKIDVIVSDQRMPGMKGTELLKQVKKSHPNIGRIILSGHSDINDLTDAINEANINQFLHKPWKDEHLIETVKNVMALPRQKPTLATSLDKSSTKSDHHVDTKPTAYKPSFAISSLIKESYHISLEKDIKADRLHLDKPLYQRKKETLAERAYYQINWPTFCHFGHDGIVNMANQSGYLQELYSWYLLSIHDALEDDKDNDERYSIDLFSNSLDGNRFNHALLMKLLKIHTNLCLRIPFQALQQKPLQSLLELIYRNNHSLHLNVEKRVIDVNQLTSLPISSIEMDGSYSSINNGLLTEKRLKMLSDAQNCGIKTILSQCRSVTQHDYAVSMGFDYF